MRSGEMALFSVNSADCGGDCWGDPFHARTSDRYLWIVALNSAGLPTYGHHPKYHDLQAFMLSNDVDVLCLSETNIAWQHVEDTAHLSQIIRPWFRTTFCKTAWFRQFPSPSARQPGGVALIIRDAHCGRVMSSGTDPSGLGRWVWARLRGVRGQTLVIVSAYRPVFNSRDVFSVWSQYRVHFDGLNPVRLTDPLQAFLEDLAVFLEELQQSDDHVVVCMDANEDLRAPTNPVTNCFAPFRMRDAVFSRHDGSRAPPTHQRGSHPIDGIFLSSVLPSSSCGYLPFGSTLGDHRPVWTDLDVQDLFRLGTSSGASQPSTARRLQCSDPRVVSRYNSFLNRFYQDNDIPARAFRLEQAASTGLWTPALATEWEHLDHLRVTGIVQAESKCRRLRTGHLPWSPSLSRALLTHRLWDRLLHKALGNRVSWSYLHRLATKLGIDIPDPLDVAVLQHQRDSAWEAYKCARKSAAADRTTHLARLAQARADAGLESQASAIKVMATRERQRREARVIKSIFKPSARRGLDRIEVPVGDGAWEDGEWNGAWMEVTTKEAIEQGCLIENDRRFRQASGTDLLQTGVIDILGPTGCSPASTVLLHKGTIPVELSSLVSEPAKAYLAQHRRPVGLLDTAPAVPDFRTTAYASGWAKMREHTASGRSGLHFGHFIAHARSPHLGAVDAALSRIPTLTGYVPSRWTSGLNVMLEKKPGVAKVSKLRTILLYEADYNQNNKALGRTMMAYAEQHQLLAPEQYGSRKFHSAIYQGLNKVLTFDLLRQQRRPGALCSNDAKSCDDRISHTAADLAMRRCGVPIPLVEASLRPIQSLRHYIRTAYGDSALFFEAGGHDLPVQGIGQGNGGGPAIWAVVSTPIFNSMRQRGYGIFLRLPLSGDQYIFVGYAFVDDTDLVVNLPPSDVSVCDSDRLAAVATRMQQSVVFWEASLRASGGALVPQKCHWYLLDFRWRNGGWEMLRPQDASFLLRVRSPSGRQVEIEQLDPSHARRTLGIRAAPDGNMAADFEYLRQRIADWTDTLRTRRLPYHMVWTAFKTGILKTLAYPLPASTFSEDQCRRLMHPLLQVALSRSHIVRSMPRAVVYGPPDRGGLDVPNLYTEQGIEHVKTILQFFADTSITGYLLRATFQALQLELGLPGHPFAHSYTTWHRCTTATWITSTWDFCWHHQITIPNLQITDMPLLSAGDCWLMDAFHAAGIRSPHELADLNWCRLSLRAASLADIVTADHQHIMAMAWSGDSGPCGRRHSWDWPRTPPASSLNWKGWQDALVTTFGVDRRFRRVSRVLGSWDGSLAFRSCALWSGRYDRLYCPVLSLPASPALPTSWRIFHPLPRCRGQDRFGFRGETVGFAALCLSAPLYVADDSRPLTGKFRPSSQIRLEGRSLRSLELPLEFPRPGPPPSVVAVACAWLPLPCQHWFVGPSEASIQRLVDALHTGTLEAVSDGSARAGVDGTCAWCLSPSADELEVISAGVRVPGPTSSHNSFRSELYGLYNIALFVRGLVRFGHGKGGIIHMATDSLSVLGRVLRSSRPASVQDKSWDLVSATLDILRSMPTVLWKGHHVRGHQESSQSREELDRWALRNVLMDERATQVYELLAPDCIPPLPMGRVPAVVLGQATIVSDFTAALRSHVNGPPLTEFLDRHEKFGTGSETMVHWEAYRSAFVAQPLNRRHWIVKSTTNRSAVGVEMVRRRQWRSASCPRCGFPMENALHVFKCPHSEVSSLWDKTLQSLATWLARRFTHPAIAAYVLAALRLWRQGLPPPPLYSAVPNLSAAVAAQRLLGWDAAFEGRWSE